jgi:hypothetical protein
MRARAAQVLSETFPAQPYARWLALEPMALDAFWQDRRTPALGWSDSVLGHSV